MIFLLVHHILPGTPEQNLVQVWIDIEGEYKSLDTKNRYNSMRMTMFTTKCQPKLKGKAADIKDMGPVLKNIWKKYYNSKLAVHEKILTVLEGSAHLDAVLDAHPADYTLSEEVTADLVGTAFII